MSKITLQIKRLIYFFLLAIIVPAINVVLFISWLYSVSDAEMEEELKTHFNTILNNCHTYSLLAFVLTYVLAMPLIKKKTSKTSWRITLYIITFYVFFFLLVAIIPELFA